LVKKIAESLNRNRHVLERIATRKLERPRSTPVLPDPLADFREFRIDEILLPSNG
jgi:hypothetical protein